MDYYLVSTHHYLQFATGIIYSPFRLPFLKINIGALFPINVISHVYDDGDGIGGTEYSYRRPFIFTCGLSLGLPHKE